MIDFLDKVTYGNPTSDRLPYLKKGEWTNLIHSFQTPFPANSSSQTKKELETLLQYQEQLKSMELVKNRFISYDTNNPAYIYIKYAQSKGLDVEKEIIAIAEDAKTVLLGLKYLYQRPRPYQLANYLNIKLTPHPSCVANTPSYPSGHSFQAYLVSNFLSIKMPNEKANLDELYKDISKSRLYLGLHYPSDERFGFFAARKMLENDLFKKKYLK